MFIQAYGAALAIVVGSLVLGHALCTASGRERSWAAPGVGLAALIVLGGATIKLPGRAATSAVICGLALLAAVVFVARRRAWPVRLSDLPTAVLPMLAASIPFLANGRVGLQGISLDNDTSTHLIYAETLRSAHMAALWSVSNGYPLGPHSLVATLGTATDIPLDLVFAALLLAVVPITALVASGLLAAGSWWRRAVVGLLCATAYLVAAFYGEGAFKETIMAALLLGFVVHLGQARGWWARSGTAGRVGLLAPAIVLVAGAFYTYSYVGLAWFGLTLGLWAAGEVISRPAVVRHTLSRRQFASAAPWIAATAALGVLLVLPVIGQTVSFFRSVGVSPSNGAIPVSSLGNLLGPLSPYEMFSIWWSQDFRMFPGDSFHTGEWSAFAVGLTIFGVIWCIRRRELVLPAAAAACVLIWWRADRTQSPYVTAKALVIASPLMVALCLRALLTWRDELLSSRLIRLAVAGLFCTFAGYSNYLALRNEPVGTPVPERNLSAFRSTIGHSAVLFLGDDDYAPWELRGAEFGALSADTLSTDSASPRPSKQWVYGDALDFDSVEPSDLDHFQYVVTSNSPYASQPPANFRLVKTNRFYELWRRTGPTAPRQVIESSGAPGAILNCSSALGRRLRSEHGVASVMATPVTVPGPGLPPGGAATVSLPLPAGRWEISIQYVSDFVVELSAGSSTWTMPAFLGRPGPFFGIGAVTGLGTKSPVQLTIRAPRPSVLTGGKLFASIPTIAATREPSTRTIVPLRAACGRYVDWFRLT